MGKNDLGLMFMWWHRIKLYPFSHAFKYLPEKKQEGWHVGGYVGKDNRIHPWAGLETIRGFIRLESK